MFGVHLYIKIYQMIWYDGGYNLIKRIEVCPRYTF